MFNAEDDAHSSVKPGLTKRLLLSREGLPVPFPVFGWSTEGKESLAGARGEERHGSSRSGCSALAVPLWQGDYDALKRPESSATSCWGIFDESFVLWPSLLPSFTHLLSEILLMWLKKSKAQHTEAARPLLTQIKAQASLDSCSEFSFPLLCPVGQEPTFGLLPAICTRAEQRHKPTENMIPVMALEQTPGRTQFRFSFHGYKFCSLISQVIPSFSSSEECL